MKDYNHLRLPDLLQKRPQRKDKSIKFAENLTSELMYNTVFSCVILLSSLDVNNRTFVGDIYPAKEKRFIVDNVESSTTLVTKEPYIAKGYGIVPESVDINTLTVNKSLVVCLALDFDIRSVYAQAKKAKSNGGNSTKEFNNRMMEDTVKRSADRVQNLIIINKLIDL